MRDLRLLPKAHLHLHLTGSMRGSTVRDLAVENGISLPSEFEDDDIAWADGGNDWSHFQRLYDAARIAIKTVENLGRVIREAAETDAADGCVWTEIQVNPESFARQFGVTLEGVVEILLDACSKAQEASGIGVALVLCGNWRRPPRAAEMIAKAASRYSGQGVVGFGLSDDERATKPEEFATAFRTARDAGLLSTPHSGFYTGPEHIRACVEHLGANRIGHGITGADDKQLLALLARQDVTLEICPTSYAPLGVVKSLDRVPVARIMESGVGVALGADDPLLFGNGLLDQYEIAHTTLNIGDKELAAIAERSIQASGMAEDLKSQYIGGIRRWMTTLETDGRHDGETASRLAGA